jgi:hypothetical protein
MILRLYSNKMLLKVKAHQSKNAKYTGIWRLLIKAFKAYVHVVLAFIYNIVINHIFKYVKWYSTIG